MQFNSYIFILIFLPIVFAAYFLSNRISHAIGKIILAVGSIVFYCFTDISLIRVFLLSMIINYGFALMIRKLKWKRLFVVLPVVINILLLLAYKYTNFAIININSLFGKEFQPFNIAIPIGISFFTFQQIAYVVAVYKEEINISFLDYAAYITFFPKILMGPLMEPVEFYSQLNNKELKTVNTDNIACGIKLLSFGLFKKMIIADTFSKAVSWGFDNIASATAADWIFVSLFYTMEIYFDFSGYCDMATGSAFMLNFTLPINFDSPYKSVSIRDFWKRWHISLTKFFTKYIYIPLGGSRKGLVLTCINTLLVFLISGLWHGANWTFVLWGLIHGLFCVFDRLLENRKIKFFEPVGWLLTFMLVNILWLLFRSDSISQWKEILTAICHLQNTTISDGLINVFLFPERVFILKTLPCIYHMEDIFRGVWMHLFLIISLLICFVPENNYRNLKKLTPLNLILAIAAFAMSFTYLSVESVFVYFGF